MPYDPSNPLYNITVPAPKTTVRRASAQLIADRPKATTEQALHCYDYIKAKPGTISFSGPGANRWKEIYKMSPPPDGVELID